MLKFNDLLLCGISAQLHNFVEGFDEIIAETDVDFRQSGLARPSLVRLGFLASLSVKEIVGTIGSISVVRQRRLLDTLSRYFQELSNTSL